MLVRKVAVLLLLMAVGATFWRYSQITREKEATIQRLQGEIRDIRSLQSLASQMADPRPEASPVDPLPGTPRPVAPPARPAPPRAEESTEATQSLRENYVAAAAAADQLRQRITELETTVGKISQENQRLAASEKEVYEKLNVALREIESARGQVKSSGERAERIETSYRTLREESRQSAERIAQLTQWSRELEDVNRRRETYLNNILRRYREVTEQYRSLSSRLERPRDAAGPAPGELSRIQNAISMAEDDLRQLQSLNAQAATLDRKYRR